MVTHEELLPSTEGEAMFETEWIDRAAAAIARYLPNFHPDDAVALADDLQRSWPTLPPEDAVQFFFWPVQPETGTTDLT